MKTGIIVAMQSEFELIAQKLSARKEQDLGHIHFIDGLLDGQDIVLMKSGIGKVNAAAATVEMIHNFNPARIINTGVAGALDPSLQVMDIVLAEHTAYHDVWCGEGNALGQIQGLPAEFSADEQLLHAVRKSDVSLHQGLIVSGDSFISDIRDLQKIKKNFPRALAVDMESAAVAQVCCLYQVPFATLRIISDTPGITKHNEQYLDFWRQAPEKSFSLLQKIIAAV